MDISHEFWEDAECRLRVSTGHSRGFTAPGRAHDVPLRPKDRFAITPIGTPTHFGKVLDPETAGELEENTSQFRELLQDPATTPEERELIRRVLGIEDPEPPEPNRSRTVN